MVDQMGFSMSDDMLAQITIAINVDPNILLQLTPMEVILGESLLTPGLQTSIRCHNDFQMLPIKNLDQYKGAEILIELERPILEQFNINPLMEVDQTIYRVDNRRLMNGNIEEYIIRACDSSLLDDAATLVSKMWKCTPPSTVVRDVLSSCAGVKNLDIEEKCAPARDYIAENIHPFQVCAQQCNVALAEGNDPSFLHYMTYENLGTHHFRSLKYLASRPTAMTFVFGEGGISDQSLGYGEPNQILTHSFPCDFDLLSDILNGIDANGKDINSAGLFNPILKQFNTFGNQMVGCGIGGGNYKLSMTNQDSAKNQNACPDYAYMYLQKRQARMGLLEQDKIALRMTVPWNPTLHVGQIIEMNHYNRNDPKLKNYGSGEYMILHMLHNIKRGGYATTTIDCVSKTAGLRGEV